MAIRVNVRRLAAIDMYGSAGAPWRRWVILVEFLAGVAGTAVIAVLLLRTGGGGLVTAVPAAWLFGLAANYVPLAAHAVSLIRPGALDDELAGVDVAATLRHYTVAQFWVLVPFLFVALAGRQRRTARR
jgi:hypothetical protein